MMYARVRTSPLALLEGPAPLPGSYLSISGFHHLSNEELRAFGWYPCKQHDMPVIDSRSQKVVLNLELTAGREVVITPRAVPLSDSEIQHELAEERRRKLATLARIRWEKETAGLTVNGIPYSTARESQLALSLVAAEGQPEQWKDASGQWHDLTPQQLLEASSAVQQYRRACFAHERQLASKVKSAQNAVELDRISLEEGWPSQSA